MKLLKCPCYEKQASYTEVNMSLYIKTSHIVHVACCIAMDLHTDYTTD